MNKMKFWIIPFLALALLPEIAHALPLQRLFQDQKLPTQAMIEHQIVAAPAAAGTTQILSANAGATSAAPVTVTTFLAQPDVPRNVVITPGGSTAHVLAASATVNGTDFFGQSISETFAFTNAQSSADTGNKAFKTITSIVFPQEGSPFDVTWSVGFGSKLGLKRCMDKAGNVVFAELNGVYEGTRPTVAASSSTISSNTVQLSSSLNGSDVDIYFVQDFLCFP